MANISDKAKCLINKNVGYMFEFLQTNCEGLSYEEILCDIFPQYILDTNFEKCVKFNEINDSSWVVL